MNGLNIIKKDIREKKFSNCYIMIGQDEGLIKSSIEEIKNIALDDGLKDLNYVEFDGRKIESLDGIINSCETLPLFSPYRMVVIFRAAFLEQGEESKYKKIVDGLLSYIPKISDKTILIIYSILYSKRDKPSNNLNKFVKVCKVIEAKYDSREKKGEIIKYMEDLVRKSNKKINKSELEMLYELYKNSDTMFIKNELDKLISYSDNDFILKNHIKDICIRNSDDDIFDLVDSISNKKFSETISILNDLIYKGEKPEGIIFFVERQFRLLFLIKHGVSENKTLEYISKSLNLNIYICKNMIIQSNKFTKKQLLEALEMCLNYEKKIKSETCDKFEEFKFLIVYLMRII
ncbi:MAG: DNA polymerase III subunit delta [Oscillospiraceae bacterium]|nr:DNA polymerase III subunit delta [Oscillospiraceae bacterium]